MAMSLKAEARKETTKFDIKQLRVKGKVPAVVYGKKVASTVITVDQKDLMALLRKNPHAIIDLDMPDGGKQPVMINEIQRSPLSRELLHVDFHQINMDEPVKTVVTLDFVGDAIGAKEGGILQIQLHELEIRCLPNQIPASITVDISNVGIGENMLVSELTVPGNVEVKSDPNELVLTILAPQKEAPEDVAAQGKEDKPNEVSEEAKEEQPV
ncbi:50S ribosomal protein L25/general stress protein Ctc [Paenibacillus sp. GCM10023248]|uniref:50S ribosomal protein L25/general stress protein Ctc n=1 Tax=unclassified Paenibacillus TaxID=185978 RepID=UPI0023792F25|nr:50S ribosomal protein L25/general stress protein Ctc [Paenibacillus sp. MAHUQ-63]MDD9272034.1 50S ribosomal protein L25/general stress protein Ctc [Paenibacillus sp. MAHUQ-63]